jgi:hypothetical protein
LRQTGERTGDVGEWRSTVPVPALYGGKLPIGGEEDFKVFIGQPGAGESSFWAAQEHFLPESEGVKATLIYKDAADQEHRLICLLKERC